jgi:hypothetical protein
MSLAAGQVASSGTGAPAQTDSSLRGMRAEQTALPRVATLVARGICHAKLFAVDGQEIAQLSRADTAVLLRSHESGRRPEGASTPSASLLDSLVAAVCAELVLDVAQVGLDAFTDR